MILEHANEDRLEALIAANAREVVLLRDELQMESEDEQRERRGVDEDLIEVGGARREHRRDGERRREDPLEPAKELVVIERVKMKERPERLLRILVP